MLSFDITDRNVRVVKGVESNGKIKISSAATLNLEEGLIVNGHVKDVPNVATLINGILKRNKMPDKEAIVSISSNLTIFKEMTVPRGKGNDLQKTVKGQMQAELNLDDSFSVTYVVVGDSDDDVDFVTYGADGNVIPDYPVPDAKGHDIFTVVGEPGRYVERSFLILGGIG